MAGDRFVILAINSEESGRSCPTRPAASRPDWSSRICPLPRSLPPPVRVRGALDRTSPGAGTEWSAAPERCWGAAGIALTGDL